MKSAEKHFGMESRQIAKSCTQRLTIGPSRRIPGLFLRFPPVKQKSKRGESCQWAGATLTILARLVLTNPKEMDLWLLK